MINRWKKETVKRGHASGNRDMEKEDPMIDTIHKE